jgi:hypothetical protein
MSGSESDREWTRIQVSAFVLVHSGSFAVFNPRLIYWAGRRVRDCLLDAAFALMGE